MALRFIRLLFALGLSITGLAQAASRVSLDPRPVAVLGDRLNAAVGGARVLGMWDLPARTIEGLRFAGLSDLAWDDDEQILYVVSDKGALFSLRIVFQNGLPADILLLAAAPLRDLKTGAPLKGRATDAEGLDIVNGRNGRKGDAQLLVSFERIPRIARYRTNGRAVSEYPLPAALEKIENYRSPNRALESVAVTPTLGIVTAPERPLLGEPAQIYSLSGSRWPYPSDSAGIVSMKAYGRDALLVLERDYEPLTRRVSITLKRTRFSRGKIGATDTLAAFDSAQGWKIDNFEGLAVHRGKRVFLISDNNDLFFQRTLLMYLELP